MGTPSCVFLVKSCAAAAFLATALLLWTANSLQRRSCKRRYSNRAIAASYFLAIQLCSMFLFVNYKLELASFDRGNVRIQ